MLLVVTFLGVLALFGAGLWLMFRPWQTPRIEQRMGYVGFGMVFMGLFWWWATFAFLRGRLL